MSEVEIAIGLLSILGAGSVWSVGGFLASKFGKVREKITFDLKRFTVTLGVASIIALVAYLTGETPEGAYEIAGAGFMVALVTKGVDSAFERYNIPDEVELE